MSATTSNPSPQIAHPTMSSHQQLPELTIRNIAKMITDGKQVHSGLLASYYVQTGLPLPESADAGMVGNAEPYVPEPPPTHSPPIPLPNALDEASPTSKNKSPAFQFYARDWLSSQRVTLLSLQEEGAYIRLLSFCWLNGSIPADPEQLARLIGKGGSTTVATNLVSMFTPHPSDGTKLIHDRLEKERRKQREWSEKSSEGGKKSAQMRQQAAMSSTVVQPLHQGWSPNGMNPKATLQSASASASIHAPAVAVACVANKKKSRKRDDVMDAMAVIGGGKLSEVTDSAWGATAKAASEIRKVSPDVTADEIRQRGAQLPSVLPKGAMITPLGLAKHWAMCGSAAAANPLKGTTVI